MRAAGAFEQKPGCSDYSKEALGPERLAKLCLGECYNPSDRRKKITHIDVIRIRPQIREGEPVGELIEDPWKRLPCADEGAGCVVSFSDPEFRRDRRDTVYYVRAAQEPGDVVNAGQLRCEYNERGVCMKITPCYSDYRTPMTDDCLASAPEYAWSSPIFVDYGRPARQVGR